MTLELVHAGVVVDGEDGPFVPAAPGAVAVAVAERLVGGAVAAGAPAAGAVAAGAVAAGPARWVGLPQPARAERAEVLASAAATAAPM